MSTVASALLGGVQCLVGQFDRLCLGGFPSGQAMDAADADGHNAVCPYSGLNYGFKG